MKAKKLLAMGVALAVALVFTSCSSDAGAPGGEAPSGGAQPAGEPVAGGSIDVILTNDPRTLDPAIMSPAGSSHGLIGNAIYGTLVADIIETGETEYNLAESLVTEDGGKTFTMTVRDTTFSDGTPFTAEAVKYNWDRVLDPATASPSRGSVGGVLESIEVIDSKTLHITLRTETPGFVRNITQGALNWIGSPEALEAGPEAFESNPIGAGPFTLESWARQDNLVLVKNESYWDAPRPYLDKITVRSAAEGAQRVSSVSAGQADVTVTSIWSELQSAKDAGLIATVPEISGGDHIALNMRRAPFDDKRARQALSAALDREALNLAAQQGVANMVDSLFVESSPFYMDAPLSEYDPERAQELFDELAAEGKPVDFSLTLSATQRLLSEAILAQLAEYENVSMDVTLMDPAEMGAMYATHEFDAIPYILDMVDPEPRLSTALGSVSNLNMSGVNDPAIDEALQRGKVAEDLADRKAAYDFIQEWLVENDPMIFTWRTLVAWVTATDVHGISTFGRTMPQPERIWIEQ